MKKILGTTLIFVSATSFVLAQTNENRNEKQIRPMMAKIIEQKIENKFDDRGVMMTTGDATIDAQIKTLLQERDQKIKAISEEYLTKLKALVGDKKILPPQAMEKRIINASGTIRDLIGEKRGDMEERRNEMMKNTSSVVTASGTVRQFAPREQEPRKNFFKDIPFLNKFFSGNER